MEENRAPRNLLRRLQPGVAPDARQVRSGDLLDRVEVSGEEAGESRRVGGHDAESDLLPGRAFSTLRSPIVVVAGELDAVAAREAHEPERTGADHRLARVEIIRTRAGRGLPRNDEHRIEIVPHHCIARRAPRPESVRVQALFPYDALRETPE